MRFSLLVIFMALLLSACGDGGSGSGGSGTTGSFSLGITDGPVDSAMQVVVEFDAIHLEAAGGEEVDFELATVQSLDLLSLQGSASASLLDGVSVPAGNYIAIRLSVNAEANVRDSYVVLDDGSEEELRIPSGSQTGLKLNHAFTVAVGSTTDFTIDFDLRKSITNPPGQAGMIMRPTLRLVDNLTVGSVSGAVSSVLINEACADVAANDGAVYLYAGTAEFAEDVFGEETDPITTALVDDEWNYEIGFVAAGQYTAAYTCENDLDDPEVDDELTFIGFTSISITADSNTVQDFDAPPVVL